MGDSELVAKLVFAVTYLAIDIGGTKISVSLGTREGEILASERESTEVLSQAGEGIAWMGQTARELCEQEGVALAEIESVGVGVPGPLEVKTGRMLNPPNLPGWHQTPLVDELRNNLGLPVAINNDGNGWALAEYLYGACKGTQNLIIITHSTGIGGGIIVNGQLVQGACDMAGEFGHGILDPIGPPSGGLQGTFEGFCGGKSVARQIREELKQGAQSMIVELVGGDLESISFHHFKAAVEAGDAYAKERWDAYLERLAQGIGMLLMTLNPQAVILGTIARHCGALMMKPLQEKLPKYAWPEAIRCCRIEPTQLHQVGELSALAIAVFEQPEIGPVHRG